MLHRRASRVFNLIIGLSLRPAAVEKVEDEAAWGGSRALHEDDTPDFADSEPDKVPKKEKPVVATKSDESKDPPWDVKRVGKVAEGGVVTGEQVVESLRFLNEHYAVLNQDKFGPLNDVQVVIVVQVHNRLEYLRLLISTLGAAKGIEKTLLVFSHDFSNSDINVLVKNITFCRVIQIFYPYNLQLFPHVFPGQHPEDCPEKMKKAEAERYQCRNWEHPDKYGNYRVAKFTQIKHHWWWKMNFVFDGIIKRNGLEKNTWVLLLEEDHYVTPDFLHVLNFLIEKRASLCDNCEILSLGFYLKTFTSYGLNIDRLGVHPWFSSKHNMGMALQDATWEKIKNCSKLFCSYDDYNWDWSMLHVSVKCLPQRLRVIFTKAPRVIHVGDCGVHTHRCGVGHAAEAAKKLVEQHRDKLFPTVLKATEVSRRTLKPSKENGGWGDVRDHQLCLLNANPLKKDGNEFTVLEELLTATAGTNFTNQDNLA